MDRNGSAKEGLPKSKKKKEGFSERFLRIVRVPSESNSSSINKYNVLLLFIYFYFSACTRIIKYGQARVLSTENGNTFEFVIRDAFDNIIIVNRVRFAHRNC